MHKLLTIPLAVSLTFLSVNAAAANLFSLKLEGGSGITPDGLVKTDSTLQAGDTDKFSERWVSDNKTNKRQSLLSKHKTNNAGYIGAGVMTKAHPLIPIKGELLFGYYPKYKLKYHGTGVAGFPTTATLTSELERYTLFLNVYGDVLKVKTSTNVFDFFIQGGLGMASNNLKDIVVTGATDNYTLTRDSTKKNTRDDSFAWNLGLGVNVAFYEDYTVGLGYRYVQFDEAKSSNVALNTGGTWDVTRNPYNIKTNSHLFYLALAFA